MKELVIYLIVQDLKHNILVLGLERMRLSGTEYYDLDIVSVVAKLMGLEKEKITDDWLNVYHKYMLEASKLEINHKVLGIEKVATDCYYSLLELSA